MIVIYLANKFLRKNAEVVAAMGASVKRTRSVHIQAPSLHRPILSQARECGVGRSQRKVDLPSQNSETRLLALVRYATYRELLRSYTIYLMAAVVSVFKVPMSWTLKVSALRSVVPDPLPAKQNPREP